MPAGTDHIRRDAEHSARSDIRVEVMKIIRRLDEAAKAHVAERLANATPGELIDGTALGREAAKAALVSYVIDDTDAIEAAPAGGELEEQNP